MLLDTCWGFPDNDTRPFGSNLEYPDWVGVGIPSVILPPLLLSFENIMFKEGFKCIDFIEYLLEIFSHVYHVRMHWSTWLIDFQFDLWFFHYYLVVLCCDSTLNLKLMILVAGPNWCGTLGRVVIRLFVIFRRITLGRLQLWLLLHVIALLNVWFYF